MRGALFTIKSARFFVYENAQRPGQFRVTMHVDELVLVGGEQCETVMAPGVQRIKELQKDPSVTQALLADMKRDLNAACPAAVVSMDMTTDGRACKLYVA